MSTTRLENWRPMTPVKYGALIFHHPARFATASTTSSRMRLQRRPIRLWRYRCSHANRHKDTASERRYTGELHRSDHRRFAPSPRRIRSCRERRSACFARDVVILISVMKVH
ncbi:hypothetical protein KCP75_21135 [Salmonella enterica subsp. enterica]|nr:hypothetical protein KCP75_21135 [Salmonella enterica subsp. enterica]